MDKTKIDWADSTWNPVTGCLHRCTYCYAHRMAKRFSKKAGYRLIDGTGCETGNIYYSDDNGCYDLRGPQWFAKGIVCQNGLHTEPFDYEKQSMAPYPFEFAPTFHRYRLDDYKNKKGRNIFVCSMADLFGDWVPDEWIQEVFKACAAAPQHRYLFLTKNPGRYKEFECQYQRNMWFGISYTNLIDGIIPGARDLLWLHNQNIFMSLEPMLEPLHFGVVRNYIDWAILGAETGNRKSKIIPKREWVENIVNECRAASVPVFMKKSLAEIWGEPLIQEFPEQIRSNQE